MNDINKDKIGLTGISWGAFLTCITAGVDKRFNAFAPIYGCGFLQESKNWVEQGLFRPDKEEWAEIYDPSAYLSYSVKPILFTSGADDPCFETKIRQKSADLCKGSVYYSQRQTLTHYHRWKDEEAMNVVYLFMDYILNGKQMPFSFASQYVEGCYAFCKINDYKNAANLKFIYTFSEDIDSRLWNWESKAVEIRKDLIKCDIPEGATACFYEADVTVLGKKFDLSTKIFILKENI